LNTIIYYQLNGSPAFRYKSSVTAAGVCNRRQGYSGLSTAIGYRHSAKLQPSTFTMQNSKQADKPSSK
jgi:hypothetical protein